MNIGEWLRGLDLGGYEQAFRENEIDEQILSSLTAEDLKEIGIGPVGHRRKLLEAIAALSPGKPQANGEEAATVSPSDTNSAERRQLTVMFCDLVDSTPLAARLDPEDLREVIAAYHQAVSAMVTKYGGFVAKYMGDGVLAYFGYPQAHEEDAERSIRAGLAIVEAVAGLDLAEPLAVRLGIASGLVVVGDLIGAGAAREQAVVGETPNLAARLQALAAPNSLIIADATRRQIGGLFELHDLGPQSLKGFAAEQRSWQVLGESRVASRFEALRSRETPLVGREEELDLLFRRWEQAKRGEGRVALVSAEPGIGKSRLVEALRERLAAEPHHRLRYFCSPHHSESALYPIIGQLERAAGFARDDDPAARRRKLEKLLGKAGAGENLLLLADLLSIPAEPGIVPLDLAPQQKKERTFAALLHQLEALARQLPVLMVFEDLHWMDPSSRELLDRTIARIEDLPVLLIATFRPEFQAPWVGQSHVTILALSRLGKRESATLVQRLAANAGALPTNIVAEIVERSDGVPLFLEEVTKVTLETEVAAAQHAIAAIPDARAAVPATLQASLLARLDRLGSAARDIAQTGAVIGREFSFDQLVASAARDEVECRTALDRLVAAGLLFQRGTPPAADYQFKHALVQDTAYSTLLRGPRQALHGRVAAAIEMEAPERAEREPEILAHHLAEAGDAQRAALYWRKAGEQAARRGANREAIGHFRRALALVEAQPEGAERWRAELTILSQLAAPMMSVYGWTAEEAGKIVERAAAAGRRLDSSPDIAPAIANLWLFNAASLRFDRAEEIANDLFRMAEELDDEDILVQAHHCAFPTPFTRGRFRAALDHIEAGAALYDRERHAHHRHLYLGHDPYVCVMQFAAFTRFILGYPEQARRVALDTVEFARSLNHPPSLAHSLWFTDLVFIMRNDPDAAMPAASEMIALSDEHGLPVLRYHALSHLGWALAQSGQVTDCMVRLRESEQILSRLGAMPFAPFALGLRAEALLAAGQYTEGLAQAERAMASTASGERANLSRLHRTRAALLLHLRGAADPEVEAELKEALAVAREQDAKGWEIGAATDLARLWAEQGRRAEAYDLLTPVYGWFTEGFDTADLKEAKALLTSLQ